MGGGGMVRQFALTNEIFVEPMGGIAEKYNSSAWKNNGSHQCA